jgi:N-acetylmuramic acid 6-phosphate etherase
MSTASQKRAEEFLKISPQFQLGALLTENSHPVTARLSETAQNSISAALNLLFEVDEDVLHAYEKFVASGRADRIAATVLSAVENGGKIFFTGCGSTGRLSIQLVSIWRNFWQVQQARGLRSSPSADWFEERACSVMAGGDFALIKAVEGFEDFVAFGKKQIADMGLCAKDVVFAITEGGETSFVIGTAWKGVEVGAKVYFVYNNPDEVLCRIVERSREIIQDARVEKINLTTGPMGITGSTRMQATTIQLCVLTTVLEIVIRNLMQKIEPGGACDRPASAVPETFIKHLRALHTTLKSPAILPQLSNLVGFEERIYRSGHKTSYFADRFGIDVLTDTTERSPTYCTPPFRKSDDPHATESWAFLFVPDKGTSEAWTRLLKRTPQCVEWTETEIKQLVDEQKFHRTCEIVGKISTRELLRFKVGLDGLGNRSLGSDDGAIAIISENEKGSLLSPSGFYRSQLDVARKAGSKSALIWVGSEKSLPEIKHFVTTWAPDCLTLFLPIPTTDLLLEGVTRAGLKMLLNALSTCTMVRLGRVMGNFMIWVVPSNLKLIDRSTRYIQKLTNLDYSASNKLLYEVIEYIEPRMKADQAYPPAVGLSVLRARHGLSNEEAEKQLGNGCVIC